MLLLPEDRKTLLRARHLFLLPAGEVDVVAQEVRHTLCRHLALQRLQQVRKPLEGLRLGAKPVEVDLDKNNDGDVYASYSHRRLFLFTSTSTHADLPVKKKVNSLSPINEFTSCLLVPEFNSK